jgi:hypothetical protein
MALQLKILFTTTGLTKTMRFTQTMSVSETLRDIKDKTNEGGRDHGTPSPPLHRFRSFFVFAFVFFPSSFFFIFATIAQQEEKQSFIIPYFLTAGV